MVVVEPDELVLEGVKVLVNGAVGYDAFVKLKTRGTPTCPELKVAVTVIGEPPAVKEVTLNVTPVIVAGAIDQTVKELPAYDPLGLESN